MVKQIEMNLQTFPECARLFLEAGWLRFFERIDGYHTEEVQKKVILDQHQNDLKKQQ